MTYNNSWLRLILALTAAQCALLMALFAYYALRTPADCIAMSADKSLALTALERPNVSKQALLSWATLAVVAAQTTDFLNYDLNLAKLQDYFTQEGYSNFTSALEAANFRAAVTENKLIFYAVASGPAIIINEGFQEGNRSWNIAVPVLVNIQSASETQTIPKAIRVVIKQVPTIDAPKGLGIEQYVEKKLQAF